MYDSVDPFAIPATVEMVAGYCDGIYAWSAAGWARFIGTEQWRIAVSPLTNDGNVLDVETGDATPQQAPSWVTQRRKAGIDPIVYVQQSRWGEVQGAFHQQEVTAPHYWIANYDGDPAIPAGAIAKQYANAPMAGGHYDLSNVDATFGGGGGIITKQARRTLILATTTTLHEFIRGLPDAAGTRELWHRMRKAGNWTAWTSLGGNLSTTDISGGVDDQGHLAVTVCGSDGQFYDIVSDNDGATWGGYTASGGKGDGLVTIGGGVASTGSGTEPTTVTLAIPAQTITGKLT